MPGPTTFTVLLTFAVGFSWLVAIGWLIFVHRQRQWPRPVRWLAGLGGAVLIMIIGGVIVAQTMFTRDSTGGIATPSPVPTTRIGTPEP